MTRSIVILAVFFFSLAAGPFRVEVLWDSQTIKETPVKQRTKWSDGRSLPNAHWGPVYPRGGNWEDDDLNDWVGGPG